MSHKLNHTRIVVFLKEPRPGRVKTRLARTIGNDVASKVYSRLLGNTLSVFSYSKACISLYVESHSSEKWLKNKYPAFKEYSFQKGSDLGERMFNAFANEFKKGFNQVIILGTDCPSISFKDIEKASKVLRSKSCVLGPSLDGGYYLIGLRKNYPSSIKSIAWRELFTRIRWSTPYVLRETIKKLIDKKLTYSCLSTKSDIDEAEDLSPNNLKKLYLEA